MRDVARAAEFSALAQLWMRAFRAMSGKGAVD
ncbi:hypothetical protein amrb99_01160 [Actinomadura sp. RB99]|nr:hypothetical protein [Actinomadura sp. RB99]